MADESNRRASIGAYHVDDSSRKKSTKISDSAKSKRAVVPNDLRASTGSCHDFCKYGKKHSSEEKPKKPLQEKIAKPSSLDELPVLIMVSGEKNKEKAVENHKSPTDTKNPSPDSKSFSPKPKISSEKKKVIKNKPLTDAKETNSNDKKAEFRKHENPLDAKYKPVLLKPKPLPGPPEIVKSVFLKDEGNKMHSNSKPVKAKLLLSSSDNSDGVCEKGRKNSESRKGGNVKLVSYPKDRNKIRAVNKTKMSKNEKVPEKILHMVETENKNNVIEPVLSIDSLSHETVISKNESLEIICNLPPVKENNHNKTPKNIVSEKNSENRTPVKLKFRNGKAMDVQSNSNVPRKLRFRRARIIGADETKSDLRIRIFKKDGLSDDKARVVASSEKVVLKHQVVKEKKDGQGLLSNDIIEQTASKLVASRKSKVKALVGAFETVISLQESKPSC